MEKVIRKYKTFEDYLDSLVIEDDQRYLGDLDTARKLVQLGYRSSGKTLTEEEFWQMKEELELTQSFGIGRNHNDILSEGENIFNKEDGNPITKIIRERYKSIVDGSLNALLFVHVKTDNRMEVSGHIDLTQRFYDDPQFQKYLKGTKTMLPQMGDLTFHNWMKGKSSLCSSDNWEVGTQTGKAELIHKVTGVQVELDITQIKSNVEEESNLEQKSSGKKKGKKEPKERRSSNKWTEVKTERDSGLRIMLWDLYGTIK